MSNLTFSGMRNLKQNYEFQIPEGLHKYQNILEKISQSHDFEQELEQKLIQLDSDRPAEKSSILNKQYAKYVAKAQDIQLSQIKAVDDDDILTNKETIDFVGLFKTRNIKFTQFYHTLVKHYSITFQSEQHRLIFQEKLQQTLVTVDPNIISLNALELCTRDVGLSGMLEQIIRQTQEDIKVYAQNSLNEEIVNELEQVKLMLDKKSQQLSQKEKELDNQTKEITILRSQMCNQIQQVYDILSKMMEETYNNKLTAINKKFSQIEHNLRQKIKLVESKSQGVLKSNTTQSQDLQKLKQKNLMLEKQAENYKLKISELEKKLLHEKDSLIASQKRIDKLQQKISQLDEISNSSKQEIIIQQQQPVQQPVAQVPVEQKPNKSENLNIKQFQSLFDNILKSNKSIPDVLKIDAHQWQWEIYPSIIQNQLELINNLVAIIISKTCTNSMYEFLLQISLFQFRVQFNISHLNIEDFMNVKQKYKFFIQIEAIKSKEFQLVLKQQLEKKKNNREIMSQLMILYEQKDLGYPASQITTVIPQFLDILIIRLLDDRVIIDTILDIITQEPQFVDNLTLYVGELTQMLVCKDNEFCEKLSIIIQRIYHSNQDLQILHPQIIQKKMNSANNHELLRQNLAFILKQ